MYDGMIRVGDESKPGAILKLWGALRSSVGLLEAKTKDKVRFKVRSADELYDKLNAAANDLGILIYPCPALSSGRGHAVDGGTMAEVGLHVVAQAIEDGSRLSFWGFGLGADQQDKAGGKAGTYAFKQAIVQACLAGGTKQPKSHRMPDTDDTDTPIPGGVRPARKPADGDPVKTPDEIEALFTAAETSRQYNAAMAEVKRLTPEKQMQGTLMNSIKAAHERLTRKKE